MVFVGSQQKPDGWRTRRQKEDGEIKRKDRNEETSDGEGIGENTAIGRTHTRNE